MKKKIISITIVGMFLIVGLSCMSTTGLEVKKAGDTSIDITKPTNGATLRPPIDLEADASGNIERVEFYIEYDDGKTDRLLDKWAPFKVTWNGRNKDPDHQNTQIRIKAVGYEYQNPGYIPVINSEWITINFKKSRSLNFVIFDFLSRFQIFQRLINL